MTPKTQSPRRTKTQQVTPLQPITIRAKRHKNLAEDYVGWGMNAAACERRRNKNRNKKTNHRSPNVHDQPQKTSQTNQLTSDL
jgi:hypothetical protein